MKFLLCLLFTLAMASAYYKTPYKMKQYDINLDLSYEDQWREFITDIKDDLHDLVPRALKIMNITTSQVKMVDFLVGFYPHKEFVKEIEAISKLSGFSRGIVFVIMKFLYPVHQFWFKRKMVF